MRHYRNNARLLMWFAPFQALAISAGYLVPFFLEKGLDQSDIFLLQSIFSLTVVLWEVPSGWVADRIGRARSIQLSAPLAATSMIAYGFSDFFWQFVLCEMLLALAHGLISGADQALLIDSLKADGRDDDYVRSAQRIHSFGFAGIVAGLPISVALVHFIGVSATIVADGVATLLGFLIVARLVEPPVHETDELDALTLKQATKQLFTSQECRWLIALTVILSTSTYIGAWLNAPYYTSIGVPLILFSTLGAGRSLLKAWLSHRVHIEHDIKRSMGVFAVLAGLPYMLMATGQPWLAFAVFGHDAVHSLQAAPLAHRYNKFISSRYRAMLNSVVGLLMRLAFAIAGPLAGYSVDHLGLQRGLFVIGTTCGALALFAYRKVLHNGSFEEGR